MASIKSYRYGLFREGNSRIVIDLNRPVSVSDALVLPPSAGFGYRVVIDLFPSQQAKSSTMPRAGPPTSRQRESEAEKAAMAGPAGPGGKKVVVIDPGHGGIDSGTNGVNGLMEKDLVLAEGLRLSQVLKARGYTVHMTRDRDVFIPLPERVAIARKWHADLMISLHADSNPDPVGERPFHLHPVGRPFRPGGGGAGQARKPVRRDRGRGPFRRQQPDRADPD